MYVIVIYWKSLSGFRVFSTPTTTVFPNVNKILKKQQEHHFYYEQVIRCKRAIYGSIEKLNSYTTIEKNCTVHIHYYLNLWLHNTTHFRSHNDSILLWFFLTNMTSQMRRQFFKFLCTIYSIKGSFY